MTTGTQQRLEGRARQLLEEPNFAFVATVGRDGAPHVTPVWVHVGDDGTVELNSAEGRLWPRQLENHARIAINVPNRESAYEFVEVRGTVVEMTREGADDHIDMLSKKYVGEDEYPFRKPGEVRLLIRVRPERVRYYNGG